MPLPADLEDLLHRDLSFQGEDTAYATHPLHPFPAKFPPQLPRLFIRHLTGPGEPVLDPMAGSGTTLVEAMLLGRQGIGLDIDPLAVLIARAKTAPPGPETLRDSLHRVAERATGLLGTPQALERRYRRYPEGARRFFEYWFPPTVRRELCALATAIAQEEDPRTRTFLRALLSATIIAKRGGVSLARDLAHSRPHRDPSKQVRSPIDLFLERGRRSAEALERSPTPAGPPLVIQGDASALPLGDGTVSLVVTSPPYAAAIDYLRVSKFSLFWLGVSPRSLAPLRRRLVGSSRPEAFGPLPSPLAREVLDRVAARDPSRARALHRYFAHMEACLREMFRVLRPGAPAILVVGPSRARGIPVPTPHILAEIARAVGFQVVGIGWRRLDRDRRLLPARRTPAPDTGIEARIHREGVLGLLR